MNEELPAPSPHAKTAYNIVTGIISSLGPFGTVFKLVLDDQQARMMDRAERILLKAVADSGISVFDDEKFEFFVPAAYRFLEQVRLGEYEHNLKILAELIANDLTGNPEHADVGKVGRAARKLEHISRRELETLIAFKRAWEDMQDSGEVLVTQGHLNHSHILAAHNTLGTAVDFGELNERLHELELRGIVRYSPPAGFFQGGFTATGIYREIIEAVANASR